MLFNYLSAVESVCNEWVAQGKEFSAFDVTVELRDRNNKSFAPQQVYHSIVRNHVHTFMKTVSNYGTRISDNGAYSVYECIAVAPPIAPVPNPSFFPTFGSLPTAPLTNPIKSTKSNVALLKRGVNGKFTVPKSMLNDAIAINTRTITVKFMTLGKVTSNKKYEIDKSNNIRFRLACNTVIVQTTSNPTVLIVRGDK